MLTNDKKKYANWISNCKNTKNNKFWSFRSGYKQIILCKTQHQLKQNTNKSNKNLMDVTIKLDHLWFFVVKKYLFIGKGYFMQMLLFSMIRNPVHAENCSSQKELSIQKGKLLFNLLNWKCCGCSLNKESNSGFWLFKLYL